jgi:putative endonuclease
VWKPTIRRCPSCIKEEKVSHFVYIVRCADGTFYTGYTTDVQKRVDTHNKGKGAKYTRARVPVVLVWWSECESKSAAQQREYVIKQMTRKQKKHLIEKV